MAYDLPPSYSAATGQHASFGDGLSFVDFLPTCLAPGGFISKPQYEPFGDVVTRANKWLQENMTWEAKTCESVEFALTGGQLRYQKLRYCENGKYATCYIRGLRLWIVPRSDLSRPPQEIGYFNLVPDRISKSLFSSPTYATLNDVINNANTMFRSQPLPGRIITVESQEMKVSSSGTIDADRSFWTEHGDVSKLFVFIIRVFYEKGPPAFEEIGIADFAPTMLDAGGLFSHPQFEVFSSVVTRASQWCSTQISLRFCNAQSVEIKLKSWKAIDTQRMSFTEHGSVSSSFIRILRIVYCKSTSEAGNYPPLAPPLHLTCRTFEPIPIKAGILFPKLEDLASLKARVEAWVKATGARVLSAETIAMRLYSGKENPIEASYTYNYADRNEYYVYVIRIYMDGYFAEPPPHMLPPVPHVDTTSSCQIS